MEKYLVNDLNILGYQKIITLLDYKKRISSCLKKVKMPPSVKGKVLVDTVLVSGMNSYRFLEVEVNLNGNLNLNNYSYIVPSNTLLSKANSIINREPVWLNNSILTSSQKELISTF